MTIDEMIAVLQGAKAGKTVQYQNHNGAWYDYDNKPANWWLTAGVQSYRIKPEPREWWLQYSAEKQGQLIAKTAEGWGGIHVREVIE